MMKLSNKWILTISLCVILALAGCQDTASSEGENTNTEEDNKNNDTTEIEEIVGIEPGSGTMDIAKNAIDEYDLDTELVSSSETAMLAELTDAIENEEPIVVTLWQPHWMFNKNDLKFLDDPKEALGESENIHTMVREGLEDDQSSAYEFLDNFYWDIDDMNDVMMNFSQNDDVEPRDAAKEWIDENQDKVDSWTEGIEPVDDETIELAYISWDTELSSTNVVKLVLEDLGYEVELTEVEMGVAFEGLAQREIDGMLIAWLPTGAGNYLEKYEDDIVDLGPNLEGAQQGFVVPEYMDIDSIEDLQ